MELIRASWQWAVVLALAVGAFWFINYLLEKVLAQRETKRERAWLRRLEEAKGAVAEQPEKARPVWELAVTHMEGYFERNLDQMRSMFNVARLVMLMGFGIVVCGLFMAFQQPGRVQVAIVSAAAGVLTEFIGATFIVLYRSILNQTAHFMGILERINTVGMAAQLLDSVPESGVQAKTALRAEMARIVVAAVQQRARQSQREDERGT